MDPNFITVSNLTKKLNDMNLSTSGNDNELIQRLNQADLPSGDWMRSYKPVTAQEVAECIKAKRDNELRRKEIEMIRLIANPNSEVDAFSRSMIAAKIREERMYADMVVPMRRENELLHKDMDILKYAYEALRVSEEDSGPPLRQFPVVATKLKINTSYASEYELVKRDNETLRTQIRIVSYRFEALSRRVISRNKRVRSSSKQIRSPYTRTRSLTM